MNRRGTEGAEEEKKSLDLDARDLTHGVIGAAIEVHRLIGPGFLESTYEDALAIELELRGIPIRRQVPIDMTYKGRPIGKARLDMLVAMRLVVELKAVENFAPIHTAQVLSYLRATKLRHGLLINFNVPALRLGVKRVIHTHDP